MRARGETNAFVYLLPAIAAAWTLPYSAKAEPGDVRQWFETHWSTTGSLPSVPEVGIRYRHEQRWTPPPAELERLRAEVAGKPDHPDRNRLRMYDQTIKGKPVATEWTVWYQDAGNWRANQDYQNDWMGDLGFVDTIVTKKTVYSFNPKQLTVLEPQKESPEGYDYPNFVHTSVEPDLGLLFDGGCYVAKRFGCVIQDISQINDSWQATIGTDGLTFSVKGKWSKDANRPFTESVAIVKAELSPKDLGRTWESTDWIYVAAIERWIARKVVERGPDRREDIVRSYLGTRDATFGGFEALTAPPDMNKTDPIRGLYTFVGVKDFTSGLPTTMIREGASWVQIQDSRATAMKNTVLLRWLGWIAAVSLIVGLVVARLRKSLKTA